MKKLFAAIIAGTFLLGATAAEASNPPKTKVVCKQVIGKNGKPVKNKDGSIQKTCKTIKVHKKYEGTKVPTSTKKK